MSKASKIIIVCLVIVLIVFARLFYSKVVELIFPEGPKPTLSEVKSSLRSSVDASVAGDRKASSDSAFKALDSVFKINIATSTVSIIDCVASPATIKVRFGDLVSFINNGESVINLVLPYIGERKLVAKSVFSVKSSDIVRNHKIDAYTMVSYTCKGKKGPIGYISVFD